MQSIASIDFTIQKTSASSRRTALLAELHGIYTEYAQSYPIRNKKRYFAYIKKYHPEAMSAELYNNYKSEFKKTKLPDAQRFLEYIKADDFRWWGKFSHLKGEEGNDSLRHIISVARSKMHRGECVASYVLGCCKAI